MNIGNFYTLDFSKLTNLDKPKWTTPIKQNDTKRTMSIMLISNSSPIDLTNHTVKLFAKKPDGTLIFNNATILNEQEGAIEVEISNQIVAVEGIVECEIVIYSQDGLIATSQKFELKVMDSLKDDAAIESTNEFTALTDALMQVHGIDAQLTENTQLLNDALDGAITEVLNNAIVQTDIEAKLLAKEEEYAPRLTKLENTKIKKYGVIFTGSNPVGVRTDDAVGMVANVAVNEETVINDFDNVPFFNRPICCGHHDANGKFHVNAYRGEPGFAFDGSNGEVFYECTPFYWNGSYDAPSVTGTPCEGYQLAPMFKNGVDKVYLPSYWLSIVDGKATSRSGTVPTYDSLNGSMNSARTYNANAHTETIAARMSEYILQLVEFATRDLQTVMMGASNLSYNSSTDVSVIAEIGVNRIIVSNATASKYAVGQSIVIGTPQNGSNIADRVNITSIETYDANNKCMYFDGAPVNITVGCYISSRAWDNGATDVVVASSGSPVSNTDGKYPCIWRGKVDPWANAYSVICDILIKRTGTNTAEDPYIYTPYLLEEPRKYSNGAITEDYTQLRYNLPGIDGYAKTLGFDSRFNHAALTTEVGASSTTYLSGYYYYPRYDVSVVFVGGYWASGRYCSPVYFDCNLAPSLSSVHRLARLFVSQV